eukprot:GHVO01029401.1.p1 GENE.GHVO01029401.1~~GHVO01029401.1.p1  ORF type:complete len:621 (+),score=77.29 GHVO01029401.1:29-1891(+)
MFPLSSLMPAVFTACCLYIVFVTTLVLTQWRRVEDIGPPHRGASDIRMVCCSKVSQEDPYIVEWIHFHRLQGFDKFILYTDAVPEGDAEGGPSAAHMQWLPSLFDDAGFNGLVEVLSAPEVIPDLLPHMPEKTTLVTHRLLQPTLMGHCVERWRKKAKWVVHIDVDEFLHSPRHGSVWEYLSHIERAWLERSLAGPPAAVYARSVVYGSSGQFWDFRNNWHVDPNTGETVLTFDPRDSLKYTNISYPLPDRFSTLEVPGAELKKLERFKQLDDIKGVVETRLEFNALVEEMFEEHFSDRHELPLFPDGHNYGHELPMFPDGNNLTQSSNAASKEEIRQLELEWARHYPLVIESQLLRLPSATIDGKKTAENVAMKVLPQCQGSEKEAICEGKMSNSYTLGGKTVYRTEAMRNFKKPSIRGCRRPGVHGCNYRMAILSEHYAEPKDLRVDHHQFRSIEKRTLKHRSWRGGEFSLLGRSDFFDVQTLTSSLYDDTKLKYVDRVRAAISEMRPMPKIMTYNLDKGAKVAGGIMSRCSPLDVYTKRQSMCPKEFPYVGIPMTDAQPPNQFLPYAWCSEVPVPLADSMQPNNLFILTSGTKTCPDFPEASCCDYDARIDKLVRAV